MCGIAGILNFHGQIVVSDILRAMTGALTHRGPDGEGLYIDKEVGLGHRRLAIIDLSSAGNQPMTSSDGRYTISYNGELYNFLELRSELERLGHQFRSRSDVEVMLEALARWGEAALPRFNGMYAFALWDAVKRELLLARDRYGVKPLYYTEANDILIFASEVKAILQHPAYTTGLNKAALLEYMTFQNLFTDSTLFKGIKLLPAGCSMRVAARENRQCKLNRYWDYHFEEVKQGLDEGQYVEELDRLFCQAVKRQLVSDVGVSCYLSGGMDSGSITAVAASHIPNIKTFTCGFDLSSASGLELGFDERQKAEMMSYLFRTEHYEMVLKSGDMERVMPKLVRHLEEPRVGQSYPNFFISQLASKFGKVVLSGTGGDEIFGGYPWRYYRAAVNDDFEHYIDKYYSYWQRLVDTAQMPELLAPIWNDVSTISTRDIFKQVFVEHSEQLNTPEDYINHSLYMESKTFLHGLLVVEDKLSMAHGLETRVPFLDNDLVDFATKVPVRFKLGNLAEVVRINENEAGKKTASYYSKTNDGKLLLRRMMERYIPSAVTRCVKQGFSAPDASWFRGESIEYVKRALLHPKARIYDCFDRKTVHALVNDHLSGKVNRRLLIWSLLYLENWLQEFIK